MAALTALRRGQHDEVLLVPYDLTDDRYVCLPFENLGLDVE